MGYSLKKNVFINDPSTSGVKFESQKTRTTLPASSSHRLILSGKALETGTLIIRGCIVQAPGGASQEFILPLRTDEEEERLARIRVLLRANWTDSSTLVWSHSPGRGQRSPSSIVQANLIHTPIPDFWNVRWYQSSHC